MKTNTLKGLALAMAVWSAAAWSNEIYMEQVGSSSTITITQDGASNSIGTALTPSYIGGGSNTVTIDQFGASNELQFTVNGASADLTISVTGNNNVSSVTCGTAMASSCSGSAITQTIVGDGNTVTQTLGAGANHTSTLTVTGDTNTVTHTSTNTGAVNLSYTVTGDTNTISLTTAGTTAKTLNASTTGNNNTVTIVQTN